MRWIYDNGLDDGALTESSQDASFPAENVQDIHLTTTWRATGDASENIVIDAGVGNTITATCAVVSGHNLTNAATITVQMHSADAWGAPDFSETIAWREDHAILFFTSTTKRYARFLFEDGANPDTYIEVGRLFLGTYLQVDPSSIANFSVTNVRNDTVVDTETNNTYGTIGVSYRLFDYSFPPTDYAMINSIRTVFSTVGKYKPIWMLNYDTLWTEFSPAYARIGNDFQENWVGHNKASYNMIFREVT